MCVGNPSVFQPAKGPRIGMAKLWGLLLEAGGLQQVKWCPKPLRDSKHQFRPFSPSAANQKRAENPVHNRSGDTTRQHRGSSFLTGTGSSVTKQVGH